MHGASCEVLCASGCPLEAHTLPTRTMAPDGLEELEQSAQDALSLVLEVDQGEHRCWPKDAMKARGKAAAIISSLSLYT